MAVHDLMYHPAFASNIPLGVTGKLNRHGVPQFSSRGIDAVVDYFKRRGHTDVVAWVPHFRFRTGQGGNSIGKIWLEKPLEFWLKIPYTNKKFKNGQFRHVTESKWNLNPFFKPKLEPKLFLMNCHSGPRARPAPQAEAVGEPAAVAVPRDAGLWTPHQLVR